METANEDLIPITITYLRMERQPTRPTPPAPATPHAIMRAEKPTVHFYRYLYNTVGEKWTWSNRRYMSDDEVAAIVQDDSVEIVVLYVKGVPAGFAELDFRGLPDEAELAYFGLMPEFIGRKLGSWFLHWAISELWARGPKSIIVNTCTADHPSALPMYQRMGFVPYRREDTTLRPIPKASA